MGDNALAFLQGLERPALVGMIHVGALPGTPRSCKTVGELARSAVGEAAVLAEGGVDEPHPPSSPTLDAVGLHPDDPAPPPYPPRTESPRQPYDAPARRDSGSFSVVSDSSNSLPTTVTGASLARSSLILSASPTTTMAI